MTAVKTFQPQELFNMFKLKDKSDVSKLLTRVIKVFESLEESIPETLVREGKEITFRGKYNKAIDDLKNLNENGGKITELSDAERILSSTLNLLIYLKPGDSLETSNGSFNKLSSDLIFIDTKLDKQEIVDSMEKRKIIKFPV